MKRTIFLSLLSFVLILFLMLNLMIVQLHSSSESKQNPVILPREGKLSEITDGNIYKAQIQRKPKTANFDETDNEINLSNGENFINEHQLQPNRIETVKVNEEMKAVIQRISVRNVKDDGIKDKVNSYITNDADKNKGQRGEGVEDMENIDDQYQEDDDDDDDDDQDEDDEDDEYEYDDDNDNDQKYDPNKDLEPKILARHNKKLNTNPVFKPGDFGDIRGLEFYRKPKLKVEELRTDPEKVSEAKPTEKPVLIENGIYWSTYVESQVAKGKNGLLFFFYPSPHPSTHISPSLLPKNVQVLILLHIKI